MNGETIFVEVAYARSEEQTVKELHAASGITVEEAINQSGIMKEFPEINLSVNKVGVFGKAASLKTALHQGDRVEIYRPLIADPKEARKKRAAKGKSMKKGGG